MVDIAGGTLVADRYRLVAPVDDAGAGEGWRAEDTTDGAAVVLTLLPARDETTAFEAFAARLATLSAKGIVRTLGHGVLDGRPYLVTEAVEGTSLQRGLDDAAARNRLLAPSVLAAVLDGACEALAALHALDPALAHGAVTPASLMVSREDGALVVRVRDAGLAGLFGRSVAGAHAADYEAPELDDDPAAVTPACDVFALGAITMECTNDRRGGAGKGGGAKDDFSAISSRRNDLPPALTVLSGRAIQVNPSRRHESMAVLRAALATAFEGSTAESGTPASADGPTAWMRFVPEPGDAVAAPEPAEEPATTAEPAAPSSQTMMYDDESAPLRQPPPRLAAGSMDRTVMASGASPVEASAPVRIPPPSIDRTMMASEAGLEVSAPVRISAPSIDRTMMASEAQSADAPAATVLAGAPSIPLAAPARLGDIASGAREGAGETMVMDGTAPGLTTPPARLSAPVRLDALASKPDAAPPSKPDAEPAAKGLPMPAIIIGALVVLALVAALLLRH